MNLDPVVLTPGDLDIEERLAGPVTFRMAGWLAVAAVGVALLFLAPRHPLLVAPGLPLVLVGTAGAFWRPGGRSAAAWLRPLAGYRRRTRGNPRSPEPAPPVQATTVEESPSEGQSAGAAESFAEGEWPPDSQVPRWRRQPRAAAAAGLLLAAIALAAAGAWRTRSVDRRLPDPAPAVTPQPRRVPPVVIVVPVQPAWPRGEAPADDHSGHDCLC